MSDDALIRLENLKALNLGPTELSASVGSSYQYWRDLLAGHKSFGEKAARKIEEKLGLPRGSLDTCAARGGPSQITTPRGEEQSNVSEMPRRAKVPLISLIQAGELTDVEDLFHPGMATHWVEPRYTTPSEASYALMVEGDSMESPVPGALTFPEGTIVIVDPNGAAGPNSYVIAKDVFTQKATFKKLTTDGVRWFLKPLNPAYATVEIDDPAMRVIGKVVEHQPPGGKL